MSQSSYRDEVYATFGILTESIKGDTTRRFGFVFACYHLYCFLCHFGSEVIKHDAVYSAEIKNLLQFVEAADFYFYFQVFAFFLAIFFGTSVALSIPPAKST